MTAAEIIGLMGGRAEVMRITRLSKGRLSQMVRDDHIPRSWLLTFHAMRPDLVPHPDGVATPEQQALQDLLTKQGQAVIESLDKKGTSSEGSS